MTQFEKVETDGRISISKPMVNVQIDSIVSKSLLQQCTDYEPKAPFPVILSVYQQEIKGFTNRLLLPFDQMQKMRINNEFRKAVNDCGQPLSLWQKFLVEKNIWFNQPKADKKVKRRAYRR
jgi:hypothetical protein